MICLCSGNSALKFVLLCYFFLSNQPCYPWLESDTPAASTVVCLFTDCIKLLHESFKGG